MKVSLFHKDLHFIPLFFNLVSGLYAPFGPMAVFGCNVHLILVVQLLPPPHTGILVRHVLMRITQTFFNNQVTITFSYIKCISKFVQTCLSVLQLNVWISRQKILSSTVRHNARNPQ